LKGGDMLSIEADVPMIGETARPSGKLPIAALLIAVAASLAPAFAQASSPHFATLYKFSSAPDGANPSGALISGANGVLYGTTAIGGSALNCGEGGCGTVFEMIPPASPGAAWTETVLYSFLGSDDGGVPVAGVTIGKNGVLYGTTNLYGSPLGSGAGTVFELMPPASQGGVWPETTLYVFGTNSASDGVGPDGRLAIDENGVLYGTTTFGGTFGYGTVFQLTPPVAPSGPWMETILYDFNGGSDGGYPAAGVVLGRDGVLYGTASTGGDSACLEGCGVVFKLSPPATGSAWTYVPLHLFTGYPSDGETPLAGLTLEKEGVLYGTTGLGGTSFAGTVFSLTPPDSPGGAWMENILYSFAGGSDGENPSAVIAGGSSGLYGVTQHGGTSAPCGNGNGCGVVYKLAPPSTTGAAWTETVLHRFSAGNGANPQGPPCFGLNGRLYGTTYYDASYSGNGTVFAVIP
jgi:hypothetical protein